MKTFISMKKHKILSVTQAIYICQFTFFFFFFFIVNTMPDSFYFQYSIFNIILI